MIHRECSGSFSSAAADGYKRKVCDDLIGSQAGGPWASEDHSHNEYHDIMSFQGSREDTVV